jgi:formylmethanofuran dehydrogenase subunit E-like metal-binding protein
MQWMEFLHPAETFHRAQCGAQSVHAFCKEVTKVHMKMWPEDVLVQTSDGKSIKVGEEGSSVRSRSSSGSSDELVPDDAIHINKVVKSNAVLDTNQVFQKAQAIEPNQVSKNALATKSSAILESKDVFYAFEIPIKPSDTTFLTKNPEKSSIWLSR